MPRRIGGLYEQCFSLDALFNAYKRGRNGKRKTMSVLRFERDLGANLSALRDELMSGKYKPAPYRRFMVMEPKPREISAPAFRDVVVQHAIYAVINPIFDRLFVSDSYGCRIGKGTHRASDKVQQNLRRSSSNDFVLQLDIRKFYYSINRDVLKRQIERRIKDKRLVDLMMMFAKDDRSSVGVPIGNLLSQLYALIYLNELDHFVKRDLGVKRYVRYVDDFILWCESREQAIEWRDRIIDFLRDRLHLRLSRWTIAPVSRGVNFVGFRTWKKRRFVRKHSLFRFSRSLKAGDIPSLNSIIGNALRTSSYAHMCVRVMRERPELIGSIKSVAAFARANNYGKPQQSNLQER